MTSILAGNDRTARHNREHFREHGVLAINLMGSPGSGKTAILEATARATGSRRRLAAISGDLATDRDAERLRAAGIPSSPSPPARPATSTPRWSTTRCTTPPWRNPDLLFIENVGNLVCPAVYDLGQAANVVALSVTEGEDKPLKYPVMFRKADLVLLTKIDLLPHLPDVSVGAIADALARVMPRPVLCRCRHAPAKASTGGSRGSRMPRPRHTRNRVVVYVSAAARERARTLENQGAIP